MRCIRVILVDEEKRRQFMIHNLLGVCIFPVLVFKEKMFLLSTGKPMNIFEYISALLEISQYYSILFAYVFLNSRPNIFFKR